MNKRSNQVYPDCNQCMDDMDSEDIQSEDFSYQDEDPPQMISTQHRKISVNQPRPQTATQYLQERRISSSPPARYLGNTQQHAIQHNQRPIQQQQQQQQQRSTQQHLISQKHPCTQKSLPRYHPGLQSKPTPQTQRQVIQRPHTAHTDRYISPNVLTPETYQFSDRIVPKNIVPQNRKVLQQYTSRFAHTEANHQQRINLQANSGMQKRPTILHSTAHEKVTISPLGLRYEENRSSEAAQNIALNFQTSQSSDLTFDKEKQLGYTNYSENIASELGCTLEPPEPLEKSVSQIKTNPIESAITGRNIDICGDGQTTNQSTNCSVVIDQAIGLEKSKKMIVNLIDSAIQQLKTRDSASKQSLLQKEDGASVSVSTSTEDKHNTTKRQKMECIGKLETELTRLKILEEFNEYV